MRARVLSRLSTPALALLAGVAAACAPGAEPDLSGLDDSSGPAADTVREPEPAVSDTVFLVADLDPGRVWAPDAPEMVPVPVGIFLYSRQTGDDRRWSDQDAVDVASTFMRASDYLAQCEVRLQAEAVQVIFLPDHLRNIQGTSGDTWGGHPPGRTADPGLFNYEEDARLTEETRELFGYGKDHTRPNTISIFVVEEITYATYAGVELVPGLSFPPNIYHQESDYPARNSVLIALGASRSHGLPVPVDQYTEFFTAHELGHMLLNTGLHSTDPSNLMSGWGGDLTAEQCERMRYVREWLYGEEEIADPGPP